MMQLEFVTELFRKAKEKNNSHYYRGGYVSNGIYYRIDLCYYTQSKVQ